MNNRFSTSVAPLNVVCLPFRVPNRGKVFDVCEAQPELAADRSMAWLDLSGRTPMVIYPFHRVPKRGAVRQIPVVWQTESWGVQINKSPLAVCR